MPRSVILFDPTSKALVEPSGQGLDYRPPTGLITWVDLEAPTREDFARLRPNFDLHHLAVEDCLHLGQRPKFEAYDHHLFMVLHHVSYLENKVQVTEMEMFVGKDYVITAHAQPLPLLADLRQRWTEAPESGEGAGFLAYLIADALVDEYFPLLDQIESRVGQLDVEVFERLDRRTMTQIFQFKKDLLQIRRIVGPTRDAFVLFMRREHGMVGHDTILHLQDVYDHLIRIADAVDLYRDLASGVQEAYMSLAANRTNDTMKVLTVISTILMVMSLIAGIEGMNFAHMPELRMPYAYPAVLALMVVLSSLMAAWFKRIGYW